MEERKKIKIKCSIKFKERQKRFHIIIVNDAGAAAAEKKVLLKAEPVCHIVHVNVAGFATAEYGEEEKKVLSSVELRSLV